MNTITQAHSKETGRLGGLLGTGAKSRALSGLYHGLENILMGVSCGRLIDRGEIRMKAIGQIGSDIPVVIDTWRGDAIRIISARRANRKERAQWLSRA
jgi:Ribonuclease toxin, BrnT, of type II toxin-antitoxin system